MSIAEIRLTQEEIANVFRNEYQLRSYYQLQGELEESSKIIEKLKAQILLASGHSDIALHFFDLLEKDSKKVDFLQIYQAGKDCRMRGESLRRGQYECIRSLSLDPENISFEIDFQKTFTYLIKLMPDDVTAMYPEYLLTEYRETFSKVNRHIDEFFRLGYHPRTLKRSKRVGQCRYKLISGMKSV